MSAWSLYTSSFPAAHFSEHPKHVEHGQAEAGARQLPETGKQGLIFKLKGPGQRAFEVHAKLFRDFHFAGKLAAV